MKRYAAWLGLRYALAPGGGFTTFVAITAVVGLTIGVCVLIVVLSVLNGFSRELRTRILGVVPHAVLFHADGQPWKDWREVIRIAEEAPSVVAASPLIEYQGLVSGTGRAAGALIAGIDPAIEQRTSILSSGIIHGNLDDVEPGTWRVALGSGLASRIDAEVGDFVAFMLPVARAGLLGLQPRMRRFKVVAVFEMQAQIDDYYAYVHWEDLARLADQPGRVNIRLRATDIFQAKQAVREAGTAIAQSGESISATDWSQTHGTLFDAVALERVMIGMLLSIIVAVAAFNILSTLMMVVNAKRADIAVLQTMGMSTTGIAVVFVGMGAVIGSAGVTLGVLLGVPLAYAAPQIVASLEEWTGRPLLQAYFINYLPSDVDMSQVAFIALVSWILALLSTLWPALAATRVLPARELRHA